MKKEHLFNQSKLKLLWAVLLSFSLFNCCFSTDCYGDDDYVEIPTNYEPVTMTREELKSSIIMTDSREVVASGKIYIKDDYIFINEKNKGFHIYDNSNPAAPLKVRFLEVPGATDIAIRSNVLYINQAVDLVTLKFNSSDYSVTETGREVKVFTPKYTDPDGRYHYTEDENIIVNYLKK